MYFQIEYDKFIQYTVTVNALTISAKLRSFQYRFLLNVILTNSKLFRYKVVDTNKV